MPDIIEILHRYEEEILSQTLKGRIIGSSFKWEDKPIVVDLEKVESRELLFSAGKMALRLELSKELPEEAGFLQSIPGSFRFIFWISDISGDIVEIKYLQCGRGQRFTSDLDIGFGDNIILQQKGAKIEGISKSLKKDFVYDSDNKQFLFVETYPGDAEKSFTIYGSNKRADIQVEGNKWLVRKIVKKPFPRKHSDFMQLNVAEYPEIRFVESSLAKEAYEAIQSEAAKGNTLIELWRVYSDIELSRARQLREKIGELNYHILRHLPDGVARISVSPMNEDFKTVMTENKEDLQNCSLEIKLKPEDKSSSECESFKIKSINADFSIDLYNDDSNMLPARSSASVSVIGDEIVNKRRERARKSLAEDRKFITRNLLFAIEGRSEVMFDERKRNERPLTDRTKRFLKSKFGIDGLTPNQKDAVEIALNTPDLAIIQGPPGTGKSTVVAAICDRLIEIAEKDKKYDGGKLILVSAFQNDTVEHIASKIYSMGLPTIKIGKETQGNIRSEDKLIEDIKLSIDNNLQKLSSNDNTYRITKQLKKIKSIYEMEKDEKEACRMVGNLNISSDLTEVLWDEWKELSRDSETNDSDAEKKVSSIKGLRTEFDSYNDDGWKKIRKLLNAHIHFSEEEEKLLAEAPVENPSAEFLENLSILKERHLDNLSESMNSIGIGRNLSLVNWLQRAISHFSLKEETSYEDESTFIIANLESLREDLDGNAPFIREAIKDYGESLAATNQVAGGMEMSAYRSIENVILEEAARSNPLDMLIPIAKATERIIMVGDQNQLPHLLEDDIADETVTLLSEKDQTQGVRKKLEHSLFDVIFTNLASAMPKRTITLTEQFRMHPAIGDFVSETYYDNKLKSGLANQAELKKHGLQLSWAKDKVAVFCNVGRSSGAEQKGKSKSRSGEAVRIIKLLDEIKLDPNFEGLSIGIITFYAKQVEEIFKEAAKKGYAVMKPDGTYQIRPEFKETSDNREKLRIGSVDSFQGKEFDIVILSTVRSNGIARIDENFKKVFGFLTLKNRLNVAFSRAQKLLIVVGDGEMFSDEFAQTYVEGLFKFHNNLSANKTYGNRV